MLDFHFLASPLPQTVSKRLALMRCPANVTIWLRTLSTALRPAHVTGSSSGTPSGSATSSANCDALHARIKCIRHVKYFTFSQHYHPFNLQGFQFQVRAML